MNFWDWVQVFLIKPYSLPAPWILGYSHMGMWKPLADRAAEKRSSVASRDERGVASTTALRHAFCLDSPSRLVQACQSSS